MKRLKINSTRLFNSTVFILMLSFHWGCDQFDDFDLDPAEPYQNKFDITMVEWINTVPEFSMLAEALQITGLDATLSGSGPFTLFAPYNKGFENYLADNGYTGLNEVPNDELTDLLLNHVLDDGILGEAVGDPLPAQNEHTNLLGNVLILTYNNSSVVGRFYFLRVNGSNVFTSNIEFTNGVVHTLDGNLGTILAP